MKRIRKILILIAITICILLLSENKVQAMTQEEAGAWIATYAKNYMLNYGSICEYDCDSGYQDRRGDAYKGIKQPDGMLHMDCVGFVSIVLHGAIGLDDPQVSSGQYGFIAPDDGSVNYDPEFEEIPFSMSAIKEGDILANYHHVMVYVGNGEIVHCDGHGDENNGRGAISYQSIDSYWDAGSITSAYRVKDETAAEAEQGEPLETSGPSASKEIAKKIKDFLRMGWNITWRK